MGHAPRHKTMSRKYATGQNPYSKDYLQNRGNEVVSCAKEGHVHAGVCMCAGVRTHMDWLVGDKGQAQVPFLWSHPPFYFGQDLSLARSSRDLPISVTTVLGL